MGRPTEQICTKERYESLYGSGLSIWQIARELGCGHTKVRKDMLRLGGDGDLALRRKAALAARFVEGGRAAA